MAHYLLAKVNLLANVFDNFRRTSIGEYKLDPDYFLSSPQLEWSAMLKYINHPLHLITDLEMYYIIKPSMFGRICHASVRYARANNKLIGQLSD